MRLGRERAAARSARCKNQKIRTRKFGFVTFGVTRTGIGRSARRALVVAALTAIQAVIHYRFLRFPDFLIHKNKKDRYLRTCLFCFGDPDGNRTRVTAVKGRCLSRLTTGPFDFDSIA